MPAKPVSGARKWFAFLFSLLLCAGLGVAAYFFWWSYLGKHYKPIEHDPRQSLLADWSSSNLMSTQNIMLLSCIVVTAVFFLCLCGILASIAGMEVFKRLGKGILTGLLIVLAGFIFYDTWKYFSYYRAVKNDAKQEQAIIQQTDRHAKFRKTPGWYDYTAIVQFHGEDRVIALDGDDYGKLKFSDPIPVLYNASMNDLVPVNYSPEYSRLVFAAIVAGIAWYLIRRRWRKQGV